MGRWYDGRRNGFNGYVEVWGFERSREGMGTWLVTWEE